MPIDPAPITHFHGAPVRGSRCGLFRIAVLLAAALPIGLAAVPAGAQTGERHYQVEVVIFSQPAGTSLEQRPLRRPSQTEADLEPGQAAEFDAGLPRGVSGPVAPRMLEAVARRLNTGGYTLLWHQAWVQPAVAGDGLELATLAALGRGPAAPELSGTISLTAGRFLHLGIAIELHSEAGLEAELAQHRRVRIKVEQYFDHPHLGAIALVTPVTLDPKADQATP